MVLETTSQHDHLLWELRFGCHRVGNGRLVLFRSFLSGLTYVDFKWVSKIVYVIQCNPY